MDLSINQEDDVNHNKIPDLLLWRTIIKDYFAKNINPHNFREMFETDFKHINKDAELCMIYNSSSDLQILRDLRKYECPFSFDYVKYQEGTKQLYKLNAWYSDIYEFLWLVWEDYKNGNFGTSIDNFINGFRDYLENEAINGNEPKEKEYDFLSELESFDGCEVNYKHHVPDPPPWRNFLLNYFARKTYPNIFSDLYATLNDGFYRSDHQFLEDLIKYECPFYFDYLGTVEYWEPLYMLHVEKQHILKFFEMLWRDYDDKDKFISGSVEYLKAKDKLVTEYETIKGRDCHGYETDDEEELLEKIRDIDDMITQREA